MSGAGVASLRFPLPFRVSSILGLPGQPRVLPRVYGPCWCVGIPTRDRFVWALAGHHLRSLAGVSGKDLLGRALAEVSLVNTTAPDGHPVALARLSRVADGTPLFSVVGKSGNPDDIVRDLLSEAGLRSAGGGGASADELGGRIEDPTKSVRSHIDEVCLNAGLVYSPGRPGGSLISPGDFTGASVRSYTRRELFNLSIETALDGLRNQVRVLYSSGRAGTAVQRAAWPVFGLFGGSPSNAGTSTGIAANFGLGAGAVLAAPSGELESGLTGRSPGSISRYGVSEATIELRWVRTRAQAARVLRLALSEGARPPVIVNADVDLDLDIFPGDQVDIVDDLHVPDIGPWRVIAAQPDIDNHRTHLVLRAYARSQGFGVVIDDPDDAPGNSPTEDGIWSVGFGGGDETVDETVIEPPDDGTEAAQTEEGDGFGPQESIIVALTDETTAVVADASESKREIRVPYDFQFSEIQVTVRSNTTSANPAYFSFSINRVSFESFLMKLGTGGLFKAVPVTKIVHKGNLLGIYVPDSGDGELKGVKITFVGKQLLPGTTGG